MDARNSKANTKTKKKKKMNPVIKLGRCRVWLSFKESFLVPTKCLLLKVTSCSRHRAKGNCKGLLSLYKDMEAYGEYADIQVMWEMIHSCPQSTIPNTKMSNTPYWKFCFRPT